MTIAEYQALTGLSVSDADAPRIEATIRRAKVRLEGKLGYSLSKPKVWTELGRVRHSGNVPFPSLPISDDVIARVIPSEDAQGKVLLFNFDSLDTHIRINPAKRVYSAKLVYPVSDDEFITLYDLRNAQPYLNDAGLVTAITRNHDWFRGTWWDGLALRDRNNLMLAVDGDFVNVCDSNKYPDLAYLLADMVTYYSDPNYSVMGNIRSESMDSHSYSRASTGSTPDSAAPEGQESSKKIIEMYAGPGAFRKLVR